MSHEQPIRIAAKLYEARDAVRKALGSNYRPRMRDGGKLLAGIAKQKNCGVLEVALNVSQSLERNGKADAVPFILAAAVELLEPSKEAA